MDYVTIWGGGFGLPETVALAAVAAIGYLFGRHGHEQKRAKPSEELSRALEIARQLEKVAATLRGDLAIHRAEVERFKRVVRDSGDEPSERELETLREEADRVLEPTLRLVGRVATAYDQIRRQSQALAGVSGGRTDQLTGLCNSRALSEVLQVEISGHEATGGQFAIAVFGLPIGRKGESREEQQARVLQATELVRPQLRETDLMARYGMDELVVVMPHTRLYGASVFGRRVRRVLGEAGLAANCGLTQTKQGDTPAALLGRADSALYSAKAAGEGEQYLHNGHAIRPDNPPKEIVVEGAEVEGGSPQWEELCGVAD